MLHITLTSHYSWCNLKVLFLFFYILIIIFKKKIRYTYSKLFYKLDFKI